MSIVIVPKHDKLGEGFSTKEKLKAMEHPGRQTNPMFGYQSPAFWIDDLCELKKIIVLCKVCRVHWNHRKHGYRKMFVPDTSGRSDGYQANGWCDACKQFTANMGGGTAYVSEEEYSKVCIDPVVARRNARAAWKEKPIYDIIVK